MSKLLTIWNYIRRHKYMITVLIFIVVIGFLDENSLIQRVKHRSEISALNSEIEKYRKQYEEDTEKLKELTTNPEALEKIAREKYLMKKPDPDHPKAERDWRWNLLREGEHQHAVRKKRAVHYHPGIGGAGGIRKHLKQQPLGDTETLSGWNLYHIHTSVWLWKRRGWKFSHHRIRGRNRKVDL